MGIDRNVQNQNLSPLLYVSCARSLYPLYIHLKGGVLYRMFRHMMKKGPAGICIIS